MDELLKVVLFICGFIILYVLNNTLFSVMFNLDNNYFQNLALSTLFSFFFTTLEIFSFRVFIGKLKKSN
jgi:hypothetical protein